MFQVLVEVSARHLHLSKKDFKSLFGIEGKLDKVRELSQPGEFASDKTITLKTENNIIENVRIIGPFRDQTQVEISQTDAYFLGINPPIRKSGDIINSEKCILIGPKGEVDLPEGVIIAQRHLHLDSKTAQENNLKDGNFISIKVDSENRTITFHQVVVRVSKNYMPAFHVDTDEGNAAGIDRTSQGVVIKSNEPR